MGDDDIPVMGGIRLPVEGLSAAGSSSIPFYSVLFATP